eukprot:SAG11_NODE_217_length_12229_cov_9.152185_15_plen_86_part_00
MEKTQAEANQPQQNPKAVAKLAGLSGGRTSQSGGVGARFAGWAGRGRFPESPPRWEFGVRPRVPSWLERMFQVDGSTTACRNAPT